MTVPAQGPFSIPAGFNPQQAASTRQGSVGIHDSQAGPSRIILGSSKGAAHAPSSMQIKASIDEQLYAGATLFGRGWREVESFEDMSDEEDYETDEEETYAILDLGPELDHRSMAKEANFQLIGLETATPFLKLGNQVYHGKVTDPIGDEVILSRERNENDPLHPSWPPFYKASHHLSFRPVTLLPKDANTAGGSHGTASQADDADHIGLERHDPAKLRPITMQAAAPFGPNRGGRAELAGSLQNKDRDASGRYIGTGSGLGMARRSAAPPSAAATPGPATGSQPSLSRAESQRRDSTPLRAISVAEMHGGAMTPKSEPGEPRVSGACVLAQELPSLSRVERNAYETTASEQERVTVTASTSVPPQSDVANDIPGSSGQAQAGPSDLSDLITGPPRKKGGRPLGSGKPKQRFIFESEDALRAGITEDDLASNPIVELMISSDPTQESDPLEIIKLTKKQVINILEGRPVRGKGSRAPYATVRTRKGKNPDGLMDQQEGEGGGGSNAQAQWEIPTGKGKGVIPNLGQIKITHVGKEHADAEREKKRR